MKSKIIGAIIVVLVLASLVIYWQFFSQKTNMRATDFFTDSKTLELIKAAEKHDEVTVKTLIAGGANVNAEGTDGITPLILALGNRDVSGMKILLANGANPNKVAPNGDSAMSLAAGADDSKLLQVLIEGGGDPNLRDLTRPITFIALSQDRTDNLNLLLDKGADINAVDGSGDTLVMEAATDVKYSVALELITRGADHAHVGSGGITLAWIVQHRKLDPTSPLVAEREKIFNELKKRGVSFPVPEPWQN